MTLPAPMCRASAGKTGGVAPLPANLRSSSLDARQRSLDLHESEDPPTNSCQGASGAGLFLQKGRDLRPHFPPVAEEEMAAGREADESGVANLLRGVKTAFVGVVQVVGRADDERLVRTIGRLLVTMTPQNAGRESLHRERHAGGEESSRR